MNNFNGKGSPLEDKRLTLSGTTSAGEQQYRIWRDSQQILVPRGQSITKPNAPENVQANTGVFAGIRKGYFQSPIVEFRNTHDYKLFDRFNISTFRDEFPTDPDTDLETLDVYTIDITFNLIVQWYTYQWEINKSITMYKAGTNLYTTPTPYHITTYTPFSDQAIQEYNIEFSTFFNIGIFETHEIGVLQLGNHKLYMGLQNCRINRGSSEYLFNSIFNPTLPDISFIANDIQIVRGWS